MKLRKPNGSQNRKDIRKLSLALNNLDSCKSDDCIMIRNRSGISLIDGTVMGTKDLILVTERFRFQLLSPTSMLSNISKPFLKRIDGKATTKMRSASKPEN